MLFLKTKSEWYLCTGIYLTYGCCYTYIHVRVGVMLRLEQRTFHTNNLYPKPLGFGYTA